MAKNIKFNLIIDEKPIRTLEALEENFVIDDIFNYFKNSSLEKWLEVRGYNDLAEKIKLIDKTNKNIDIILSIIDVFGFKFDLKEIEEYIDAMEYHNKKKKTDNLIISKEKILKNSNQEYISLKELLLKPDQKDIDLVKQDVYLRCDWDIFRSILIFKKDSNNNTYDRIIN